MDTKQSRDWVNEMERVVQSEEKEEEEEKEGGGRGRRKMAYTVHV